MIRIFAEYSHRFRRVYRPNGQIATESVRRRGACTDSHDGRGHVTHRFGDGDVLLSDRVRIVDAHVAATAREVQSRALLSPDDQVDNILSDVARSGIEATFGAFHQHVAVGTDSDVRSDERLVRTVEVSARTSDGALCSEVVHWPRILDPVEGGERVARAADAVLTRRTLPRSESVPADLDLVLSPGRAGAFFHELVGHPMEADIVASSTSYLGRLTGRRIAPEWLTVIDGAARAVHGYRAVVDDEGTPCQDAELIKGGVVGELLADLATAHLLGIPATGHGRRLDYRHPVIPRMTHTSAIIIGTGIDPSLPEGDWIAPLDLQLQTMNIVTGDFVFRSHNPLHYRADGAVARFPPLDLYGNGREVLRGLQPCTSSSAEYGRATKGCGKLGQFPVVVSFANAGVRLPAGLVTVLEARDG